MSIHTTQPFALAILLATATATAFAADGPRLPWADPIGVPPTFGSAVPSLPHAEPIGASGLGGHGRRPLHVSGARVAPLPGSPGCFRVREPDGRARIHCRPGG